MQRLEVEAVGVLECQLGGVLHHADPLVRPERVGQAAQQGRLAGAGLAGDQEVGAGADHADQEVGGLGAHAAGSTQLRPCGRPARDRAAGG